MYCSERHYCLVSGQAHRARGCIMKVKGHIEFWQTDCSKFGVSALKLHRLSCKKTFPKTIDGDGMFDAYSCPRRATIKGKLRMRPS